MLRFLLRQTYAAKIMERKSFAGRKPAPRTITLYMCRLERAGRRFRRLLVIMA